MRVNVFNNQYVIYHNIITQDAKGILLSYLLLKKKNSVVETTSRAKAASIRRCKPDKISSKKKLQLFTNRVYCCALFPWSCCRNETYEQQLPSYQEEQAIVHLSHPTRRGNNQTLDFRSATFNKRCQWSISIPLEVEQSYCNYTFPQHNCLRSRTLNKQKNIWYIYSGSSLLYPHATSEFSENKWEVPQSRVRPPWS